MANKNDCLKPNGNESLEDKTRIMIINYFIEKGLTPAQACAICGNVECEGGLKTTTAEGDGEKKSYGFFQFNGGRKKCLINFAKEQGKEISDPYVQLDYCWAELNNKTGCKADKSSFFKNRFQNGKDLNDFSDLWCDYYEAPRDRFTDKEHRKRREASKRAMDLYKSLDKGGDCINMSYSDVKRVVDKVENFDVGERKDDCPDELKNFLSRLFGALNSGGGGGGDGSGDGSGYSGGGKRGSGSFVVVGDSWTYHFCCFTKHCIQDKGGEHALGEGSNVKKAIGCGISASIQGKGKTIPADEQIKNYLAKDGKDPKFIILYCGINNIGTVFSNDNITDDGKQKLINGLNNFVTNCNGYQTYLVSYLYVKVSHVSDTQINALNECLKTVANQHNNVDYVQLDLERYRGWVNNNEFHLQKTHYCDFFNAIYDKVNAMEERAKVQQTSSGGNNYNVGEGIDQISDELWQSMLDNKVAKENGTKRSDLVLVRTKYWRPNNNNGLDERNGGIIVNKKIQTHTQNLFKYLFSIKFPITSMDYKLAISEYGKGGGGTNGDERVMSYENTDNKTRSIAFGFADRGTSGGGKSEHAQGTAIDINQWNNPFIKGDKVQPKGTTIRTITEYERRANTDKLNLFNIGKEAARQSGLKWGGTWTSGKDYQHFSLYGK